MKALAAEAPAPPRAAAAMRVVIVSDAWHPQVNGVVRTLIETRREFELLGHHVTMLTPQRFRTLPCPTYPEIRLSLATPASVGRIIDAARPDALHIATEGPLGWSARRHARRRGLPFTTAYHTRFPEYVAARGFRNVVLWSRGVDIATFNPTPAGENPRRFLRETRPIFLYVGRVAVEKNVEAFLRLDLPGTKWVVGEGPSLADLRRRYPGVHWAGVLPQHDLARFYAAADVFVFPSRTDTFGLVLLEALACGLPVAAYPVTGPVDVIGDSGAGALDEDLRAACLRTLAIPRAAARAHAERFSWAEAARQFATHLRPVA